MERRRLMYEEGGVSIDVSGWQLSSKTLSNYTVYESYESYHVNSAKERMIITVSGLKWYLFKVRNYSQSSYDYVIVSNLDDLSEPNYSSLSVGSGLASNGKILYTNKGKSSNSTWYDVKISFPDTKKHKIAIWYVKNASTNSYDDKGYCALPNNIDLFLQVFTVSNNSYAFPYFTETSSDSVTNAATIYMYGTRLTSGYTANIRRVSRTDSGNILTGSGTYIDCNNGYVRLHKNTNAYKGTKFKTTGYSDSYEITLTETSSGETYTFNYNVSAKADVYNRTDSYTTDEVYDLEKGEYEKSRSNYYIGPIPVWVTTYQITNEYWSSGSRLLSKESLGNFLKDLYLSGISLGSTGTGYYIRWSGDVDIVDRGGAYQRTYDYLNAEDVSSTSSSSEDYVNTELGQHYARTRYYLDDPGDYMLVEGYSSIAEDDANTNANDWHTKYSILVTVLSYDNRHYKFGDFSYTG